jgi:transaldolase
MPSSSHPLDELHAAGQSVWLDYIDRAMLRNGDLERRIRDDALMGMTSNPTIFEKALAEGHAYDEQIEQAASGRTAWELFELLETDDVRAACDIFAGVYQRTRAVDGYVSIEVSPGVARDASATIAEARRLWATVDRPNVIVKVPGTNEGLPAIRALIAEGINVNVTLLFAVEAYNRVVEAYLAGLEDRARAGGDLSTVASVASFFVSRVDTEVDRRLDALAAAAPGDEKAAILMLRGRAAVANARLAYARFQERFAGERWEALAAQGARVQRPLWASTGTKNPAYRDVLYVEELIGPHTVNTMPPATIEAFRDHGITRRTVDQHLDAARTLFSELAARGIAMENVTDKLLGEGLASFQKSFDTLIAGLEAKTRRLGRELVATR